jgi:hypothetical protein
MDTPITIGPISLPPAVIAAIIAAIASIIGAIISLLSTRNNTLKAAEKNSELETHKNNLAKELEERKSKLVTELEAYKDTLVEKQEERKARRDYQYEARKRLYQEYEPLLFQFVELSESALARVGNLAGIARLGKLEPGQGWLSQEDEYYLRTTMYRLISPLAIVRLIQRRLTLVDLTVDNLINYQYHLAKYLYHSFSKDFDFARREPKLEYEPVLEYDPYARVAPQRYMSNPAKLWRQGISLDRIDTAADTLIVPQPEGLFAIMSSDQFTREFLQRDSDVCRNFTPVYNLFLDFHPRGRPVLWRILITQAYIYTTLRSIGAMKLAQTGGSDISEEVIQNAKPWKSIFDADRNKYDWRQPHEGVTHSDDEVLRQPFEVAQTYLQDKFKTN